MSSKLWTEEQFNCPICLDLPNDPVTIPCGHSYCMGCLKDHWSRGVFSCPQCRQTFSPKPSLCRNTMLAEAVAHLRKGSITPAMRESLRSARGPPVRPSPAGLSSAEVPCDMCHGEKRAAVKSCLMCMSSYCEAHLKPHQTKAALRQHELIVPTGQLAQKICTQHKYLQEFYCRQCRMFVCWLCTSNEHKGHDSVSTKAERMERQKVLSVTQMENSQRLKERQAEMKEMKKMMEVMKRSAERVHGDTEHVLSELQRSVERLQELVEELMERAGQEKMAAAREVMAQLGEEINERTRRDTEMKELVRCEDNIHYLQTCDAMCSPLATGDLPSVLANPEATFDPVLDVILDLQEKVEDLCNQELGTITKQVNDTTLFTLGNSTNKNDTAKGGIFKLFAGRGARTATPPPTKVQSVSVGVRGAERRVVGLKSNDVRSRDTPRSPRPQQRREERETDREAAPRASLRPSPTPSRRESESLWNRSNRNLAPAPVHVPAPAPAPVHVPAPAPAPVHVPAPAPVHAPAPVQDPAPAPAPTGAFNRMASISSLFRSHRRGTAQPATPQPAHPNNNTNTASRKFSWSRGSVVDVNPGLFLDSPMPDPMIAPAFPLLREISIDSISAPEPRSRDEFLQYACNLTLDSNTAHRRLSLSEGNTKATLQGAAQPCPDTPQRFDGWTQALCSAPFSAQRCYWEVEWRGRGSSLGVAYGSLGRKGSDSRAGLGYNAHSWSLELSDTCCLAMHDNEKKDIVVTYSPRLGLFLDLAEGLLSFYSVAESMGHLHTFHANFTQPLYAAFGVGSGVGVGLDFAMGQFNSQSDSIKICPM